MTTPEHLRLTLATGRFSPGSSQIMDLTGVMALFQATTRSQYRPFGACLAGPDLNLLKIKAARRAS
jgi:hypothetical protein